MASFATPAKCWHCSNRFRSGNGNWEIGDRLTGRIKSINSSGPGTFVAEVARIAETGEIGLRLLEITPAVFVAMAGLKDY